MVILLSVILTVILVLAASRSSFIGLPVVVALGLLLLSMSPT